MTPTPQISHRLQLKTPDGTVYGPVDMATLCVWATDARVIPGCLISPDGREWAPVESIPEFRLNWTVRFVDGTTYGPLNLLAIRLLADERSIPAGVSIVETGTGRTCELDDSLIPVLVEECRAIMNGCGAVTARIVEALKQERRGAPAAAAPGAPVPAERDSRYTELLAKLKRAEHDLAVNMNLVAETQRRLATDQEAVSRREAAERAATGLQVRLEAAEHEHAAQRTRLETEVAARDQRVAGLLARLEPLENELVRARNRIQELERLLGEAQAAVAAGAHERKLLVLDLASTQARIPELEASVESGSRLLAAEQGRSAQAAESLARMTAERDALTASLEAAQTNFQSRDVAIRQYEAALADQRADAARQLAEWQSRCDQLKKDLSLSKQKEEALARRIKEARDTSARAHKVARATEHKLREELAAVQTDLDGLVRAGRALKTATGLESPRPALIDWLEVPKPAVSEAEGDFEAKFARMTLPEKIAELQRDLASSAEQKESLRHELETLRGRFEFLQKESSRKERESSEKLAQIQKEVKTSSDLLGQAMRELESRESQLRSVRKKADERVREPVGKQPALDAEVIHAEVLGPADAQGQADAQGAEPMVIGGRGAPVPHPGQVLTGMEAQLQAELKHWETLKRQKIKGGVMSKLFRRR